MIKEMQLLNIRPGTMARVTDALSTFKKFLIKSEKLLTNEMWCAIISIEVEPKEAIR